MWLNFQRKHFKFHVCQASDQTLVISSNVLFQRVSVSWINFKSFSLVSAQISKSCFQPLTLMWKCCTVALHIFTSSSTAALPPYFSRCFSGSLALSSWCLGGNCRLWAAQGTCNPTKLPWHFSVVAATTSWQAFFTAASPSVVKVPRRFSWICRDETWMTSPLMPVVTWSNIPSPIPIPWNFGVLVMPPWNCYYDGNTMGIYLWWDYNGIMMGMQWESTCDGNIMGLWWEYHGIMKGMQWESTCDGNIMGLWWEYNGNLLVMGI